MPEKETLERAKEDKKEGKAPSTPSRRVVGEIVQRNYVCGRREKHRQVNP